MAKKQKEKKKKSFDDVSSDDSFAWFSTVLALVLGIAMIVIDYMKGELCKLRDVDVTTWRDPNQKGQIPLVRNLTNLEDCNLLHLLLF